MAMKFGLFVPQGWKMDLVGIDDPIAQYEAMTAVAKEADKGPWDSVWVYDHFHTVPEPTMETTFECWTATRRCTPRSPRRWMWRATAG
jgi:alkanesulfonate monooxygenase SsuD/methylene tetrahydromethanopterin reductase-like flavin-dependent oxidoreductase (luciferase family)